MSEKVDGKDYTSNLVKLTKHLDNLQSIQSGEKTSPIMIHMSLTNKCNLDCDYCCYGNRDESQELPFKKAVSAIRQFSALGTKGLEITGGGDPSMYSQLDDVVKEAVSEGMSVGLITNGLKLSRFNDLYKNLVWMRVSLHGLNFENKMQSLMSRTVEDAREENPNIDISSVYIWTKGSDDALKKVVDFTNKHKIPTRLTPDLTLGKSSIDDMMSYVGGKLKEHDSKYVFLSDFNVKTTREHNNCYMHLIKPFVFTDGFVYDCPSLALSPDNKLNVNEKFRVTDIDHIMRHYLKPSKSRDLDCTFCKYAPQNEFIHGLKKEVKHIDFA